MQLTRVMMKSADRSRDVGGETSGTEYPGCAERVREARAPPHQAKREVDHEVTDEHAISLRSSKAYHADKWRARGQS